MVWVRCRMSRQTLRAPLSHFPSIPCDERAEYQSFEDAQLRACALASTLLGDGGRRGAILTRHGWERESALAFAGEPGLGGGRGCCFAVTVEMLNTRAVRLGHSTTPVHMRVHTHALACVSKELPSWFPALCGRMRSHLSLAYLLFLIFF